MKTYYISKFSRGVGRPTNKFIDKDGSLQHVLTPPNYKIYFNVVDACFIASELKKSNMVGFNVYEMIDQNPSSEDVLVYSTELAVDKE